MILRRATVCVALAGAACICDDASSCPGGMELTFSDEISGDYVLTFLADDLAISGKEFTCPALDPEETGYFCESTSFALQRSGVPDQVTVVVRLSGDPSREVREEVVFKTRRTQDSDDCSDDCGTQRAQINTGPLR